MKVIDILGDDQQPARPFGVEPCQRPVRRIRLDSSELLAPRVIESVNQPRIARERFGRAHIFNPVPFP